MAALSERRKAKKRQLMRGTGGQTMTREQMEERIMQTKREIKTAGPVHRRDLRKHLKRMLAQVAQYDRYQEAAQRKVV